MKDKATAPERSITESLLLLERELAAGDGEVYRRILREDAIVIVPGESFDKATTVLAMDASPGWDEFSIEDERVVGLGDDTALLTYRFHGRRGKFEYVAKLSSVYVKGDEGEWSLAFHQQTPAV